MYPLIRSVIVITNELDKLEGAEILLQNQIRKYGIPGKECLKVHDK